MLSKVMVHVTCYKIEVDKQTKPTNNVKKQQTL